MLDRGEMLQPSRDWSIIFFGATMELCDYTVGMMQHLKTSLLGLLAGQTISYFTSCVDKV
jgi:hypothetical protein